MATLYPTLPQPLSDEALMEQLYELSCDDVYPATLAAELDRLACRRPKATCNGTESTAHLRAID